MSSHGKRFFTPLSFELLEAHLHPATVACVSEIRSSKAARALAKSAAYQLRHLVDVSAFEHFLNSAAMASVEHGVDPRAWLAARVHELKLEQEISRDEQSRMRAWAQYLRDGEMQ